MYQKHPYDTFCYCCRLLPADSAPSEIHKQILKILENFSKKMEKSRFLEFWRIFSSAKFQNFLDRSYASDGLTQCYPVHLRSLMMLNNISKHFRTLKSTGYHWVRVLRRCTTPMRWSKTGQYKSPFSTKSKFPKNRFDKFWSSWKPSCKYRRKNPKYRFIVLCGWYGSHWSHWAPPIDIWDGLSDICGSSKKRSVLETSKIRFFGCQCEF